MFDLAVAVLWAAGVTWSLVRAVRQHRAYVNVEPERAPPDAPRIAAVVPARNECDIIRDCIGGLAIQSYPAERLAIFVVDDNSSDNTAAVVRNLAQRVPIRLVAAGPRPHGWAGKPWACCVGAAAAAASVDAEWLCFVDADVVPHASLIATAVAIARRRGLDMLSLAPAQRICGPAQALVMPAAFLMLAITQDLRRINDPAALPAAANGQFILIRRTTYDSFGGHAAVAGELADDKALAYRVKRSGFRLALLGGESLCECRMYRSFAASWHGLARNAGDIVNGSAMALAIATTAAIAAVAAPFVPWWMFRVAETSHGWHWAAFILALAASAALTITHLRAARYFRVSRAYGLCFPVGYLLGAAILVYSAYRRRSGRLDWKGRTYIRAASRDVHAAVFSGADGPTRVSD